MDLPNLTTFKTGNESFYYTTNLTLQSILYQLSLISIDVPFTGGVYYSGYHNPSFSMHLCNVHSDSSISIRSVIFIVSCNFKNRITSYYYT